MLCFLPLLFRLDSRRYKKNVYISRRTYISQEDKNQQEAIQTYPLVAPLILTYSTAMLYFLFASDSPTSVDTLRGSYGEGEAAVLRSLCRAGVCGVL